MATDPIVFDFGENWISYPQKALSHERVAHAKKDFLRLTEGLELKGKTFLDIGFGQGLSLLIATELEAATSGCDINPNCEKALAISKEYFPHLVNEPSVVMGSILDSQVLQQCGEKVEGNLFDIVHSWGVLHHTGSMYEAIDAASSLVKPQGHFILAIYKRHWTSHIWKGIKWFYNHTSPFIQKLMVKAVYGLEKLMGYHSANNNDKRGMHFYYDVVDWVGGYPYEFASKKELENYLGKKGFQLKAFFPTKGFTGCNEFIFERINQ